MKQKSKKKLLIHKKNSIQSILKSELKIEVRDKVGNRVRVGRWLQSKTH